MKDKSRNEEELVMFENAAENAAASAANVGMFSLAIQEASTITLLTPLTHPDLDIDTYKNKS